MAKSIEVSPTSFLPRVLCDNLTSFSTKKIGFEYRLICEEILKQKVISQGNIHKNFTALNCQRQLRMA